MKNSILLAVAVMAGLPALAGAADFKVIANPSVGVVAVSSEDLKSVFLGTKSSIGDGGHVSPVLEKGGPAHEAFLKECVGKTDAALSNYYRSLVFTGKGSMPKTLSSDADVVEYVAKTRGTVGYVGAGVSTTGVKVLEVK
jgi:hypothetical protein